MDKAAQVQLKLYFQNVDQMPVKVLEEGLCDWDQFGFQRYEGSISHLADPAWNTGRAIQIITDQVWKSQS